MPSPAPARFALAWMLTSALAAGTGGELMAGRAGEVRVESFKLLSEGVSAYNRGLYDEAVTKLRRCSSLALNSFRAYYYLGLALSASREYGEAMRREGKGFHPTTRDGLEIDYLISSVCVALGVPEEKRVHDHGVWWRENQWLSKDGEVEGHQFHSRPEIYEGEEARTT